MTFDNLESGSYGILSVSQIHSTLKTTPNYLHKKENESQLNYILEDNSGGISQQFCWPSSWGWESLMDMSPSKYGAIKDSLNICIYFS